MNLLTEELRASRKKYLSVNKPDMKLLKFYIRKHYREEKKVVINKLLKLCLKTRENYVLFKNKKCM